MRLGYEWIIGHLEEKIAGEKDNNDVNPRCLNVTPNAHPQQPTTRRPTQTLST